jgi:Icc-related predicted phosphoesterase
VDRCLFATDLHGRLDRYDKLVAGIRRDPPAAVFLGGDLFPHGFHASGTDFVEAELAPRFTNLRDDLGERYPRVLVILGNDDLRADEPAVEAAAATGIWTYCHERRVALGAHEVVGYACVPPTPFQLKDWERYDVSRYVPPGSVPPEQGRRSVEVDPWAVRHATIATDLERLAQGVAMERAVFLFHSPPFETALDRAATDGKMIDHVPLDLHVGSVAIRRFIARHQPLLTLHGHIHESTRITGEWRQRIGRTWMFSAAHDGPELCLVSFELSRLAEASRALV